MTHRLSKVFTPFWILLMIAVVRSERSSEEEKNHKNEMDKMLKVENAYLKQEVQDLRAELRVAATGSFIQTQGKEEAHINKAAGGAEKDPKHHQHQHRHHKHRQAMSHSSGYGHHRHIEPGHEFGEDDVEEALLAGVGGVSDESDEVGDGVSRLLSADLLDISEAIAHDAATVARRVEDERKKGKLETNETDAKSKASVLFVIYSSSQFYDTRVGWIRETWAKNLDSTQLVIIGDGKATNLTGAYLHQTRCKPNDRTMETCCKYAEAVIVAQTMMWQNPNLKWAYMADDDSYIRAPALTRALLHQPHSRPHDRGIVVGNYGCVTANCSDLLCGSSGYGADRWAIDVMAGGDPSGFVQEVMQNCNRCGGDSVYNRGLWGDAGLSEVVKDRGIETRKLDGVYGWLLDKSCLEFSLDSENEPLLYHSMKSQHQMQFLHRLFAPIEEQTGKSALSASALDGLGGCVEFRGNVQCAASRSEEDRPWHRGPSLCQRPRMPRMPILFGCFTLLLLFIIVSTFVWAGFRYKESDWDGWKLQTITGLKWHSYPMQGRARIR